MIVTYHWDMRSYMSELREGNGEHHDARLYVLTSLMLHCNTRLRCWPSTELLCEETGFSSACVVEARNWLIDRKAIILVPFDKREGEEKKLPTRQFVYQLTGGILTSNGYKPYLAMSPDAERSLKAELESLDFEVSQSEVLQNEISLHESKVLPTSKVETTDKVIASDDAPAEKPKAKSARARNPFYDMVAVHYLGAQIDTPAFSALNGRIVQHATWVSGKAIKVKRRNPDTGKSETIEVPPPTAPITPELLAGIRTSYIKAGKLDYLPLDILKFVCVVEEFIGKASKTPAILQYATPTEKQKEASRTSYFGIHIPEEIPA